MEYFIIWYDNFNWDYAGCKGKLNYKFTDINDAAMWLEVLNDHFPEYFWGVETRND